MKWFGSPQKLNKRIITILLADQWEKKIVLRVCPCLTWLRDLWTALFSRKLLKIISYSYLKLPETVTNCGLKAVDRNSQKRNLVVWMPRKYLRRSCKSRKWRQKQWLNCLLERCRHAPKHTQSPLARPDTVLVQCI